MGTLTTLSDVHTREGILFYVYKYNMYIIVSVEENNTSLILV